MEKRAMRDSNKMAEVVQAVFNSLSLIYFSSPHGLHDTMIRCLIHTLFRRASKSQRNESEERDRKRDRREREREAQRQ